MTKCFSETRAAALEEEYDGRANSIREECDPVQHDCAAALVAFSARR